MEDQWRGLNRMSHAEILCLSLNRRLSFRLFVRRIVSVFLITYYGSCFQGLHTVSFSSHLMVFNLEKFRLKIETFGVNRGRFVFIFVISTCFYHMRPRAGVSPSISTITPEVDRWAVRLVVFRSNSRRDKCLSTEINIADVNTTEVHSGGACKNFNTQ